MLKKLAIMLCLSGALGMALPVDANAKLYIDIISSPRRIPIAIQELSGKNGRAITDIVKSDLEFTSFFSSVSEEKFKERFNQSFSKVNWSDTGAEVVLKGESTEDNDIATATVFLYDVVEGKSILVKQYRTEKSLIRPLAHTIANDIHKLITGQDSSFRAKIAYVAKEDKKNELYLMDWDGMRQRALGIKGTLILSPYWSRDGRMLIYSALRSLKWNIYLLDFSLKKERLLVTGAGANLSGDFFPGDNEAVISTSKAGTPDLYLLNLNDTQQNRITKDKSIEVAPTVSPDGKKIAFVSDRGGSPQIYITDRLGYKIDRITFSGNYNTSPAWSPDGETIAFCSSFSNKSQIFLMKSDGTGLRRLTDAGNNEDPSFSPDGRYIAFTSDRDGLRGIYIMRIDGGPQKRITPADKEAFGPRWSPNL